MLVLEFKLDNQIIDTERKENPWLSRAAQSLAEALRLSASKKLDVEFTELVTGYRLRQGSDESYVDIYLYDSLSSGAGYAVSVSESINEIITDIKELLSSCQCKAACSKCLKHYRNQYVHGLLDRFAALDLLMWGTESFKAPPISSKNQIEMILSLKNILENSGYIISIANNEIYVESGREKSRSLFIRQCGMNRKKAIPFLSATLTSNTQDLMLFKRSRMNYKYEKSVYPQYITN